MLVKMIYLFLFSVPVAHAALLKVQSPRLQYQLTWDAQSLRLTSHRMNFSLQRRDCNGHILDRFHRQYQNFQKIPHQKNSAQEQLTYQLDGKSHTVVRDSRLGRILVMLPREIQRMKMEEALACKKTL